MEKKRICKHPEGHILKIGTVEFCLDREGWLEIKQPGPEGSVREFLSPDEIEALLEWLGSQRVNERQRRALKGPPPPPSPPRRAPDLPMGRFEFVGYHFVIDTDHSKGTLEIRLVSDFGSGQIAIIPANTNKLIIKQE